MGVAALAWALFHMDEVAMVVDALNQADTAISGLEAEIAHLTRSVRVAQGELEADQTRLVELSRQITSLQSTI